MKIIEYIFLILFGFFIHKYTMLSYLNIFILYIIFFVISILLNVHDILHKTLEKTVDEIYEIAETGDLVYFRWHEVDFKHEIISPFTHIGMIIEIDNIKYIIETHLEGDTKNIGVYTGGVHVYPLKLRLSKYEGYTFLTKLNVDAKPTHTDIIYFLENINKYKEIPFKNEYKDFYLQQCVKHHVCNDCFEKSEPKQETLMCSEFIGFCLKELKIVPPDFNYVCLTPNDFKFIKKNNKQIYNDIIKVKKLVNL
jgi:hypothetical protein